MSGAARAVQAQSIPLSHKHSYSNVCRNVFANYLSRKPTPRAVGLESVTAFYIFFLAHAVAAFYSPIQDCDEVFNYWEPTHYLNHGHGMQTWEYSPEYSIRSWAYAGIHAAIIKLGQVLPFVGGANKATEFYFLRFALGFLCAGCEARLYAQLRRLVNGRLAVVYMAAILTSPGMFHASVAYLPSSFAMYGFMLGLSAFMDWRGGMRTAQGMMWISMGGFLGWPFALALMFPFLAEEGLLLLLSGEWLDPISRVLDGATRGLLLTVHQCKTYRLRVANDSLGGSTLNRFVVLQKAHLGSLQYCSLQCLQRR